MKSVVFWGDFICDTPRSLSNLYHRALPSTCTPFQIPNTRSRSSGKDYTVHSALTNLLTNADYHIKQGIVVSNAREVTEKNSVLYLPIYYIMFISADSLPKGAQIYF